jgi:SAM-dependent methyltransferase
MSSNPFRDEAARLDAARNTGEIDDDAWFAGMASIFDAAYTEGANERAQSGFGGDETRWEVARRPIAAAIDRPGTFLDIGCANGHLLECLVRWAPYEIEPYGLDMSPRVLELARARHPEWADRLFLGNALTWEPPRRFEFVRTELVYVPDALHGRLLDRLLGAAVAPGGRLIVCGYGSPRSNVAAHPVRRVVHDLGYEPEQEWSVEAPEGGGAIVEIAVIRAP